MFEVDPPRVPDVPRALRIVAYITQTSVIDQILAQLRARATPAARGAPHRRLLPRHRLRRAA